MDNPTILRIASTAGIISTTSFWSMNYTVNHLSFPALLLGAVPDTINPSNPKTTNSDSNTKPSPHFLIPSTSTPQVSDAFLARQWAEIFWRGHRWGPLSAVLSGIAFGTAAFLSETHSTEQYLYVSAGMAAIAVVPWTLLVMMGDVEELLRRGSGQCEKEKVGTKGITGDGRDTLSLVQRWLVCNEVRAGMAVVGTICGVAASFM